MEFDFENYHKFMEKHVLSQMDIPSYNSLIEKGLAIEVTEENNPYKE